jgi:hypothetical protein
MTTDRSPIADVLLNDRGQSWVETVVMLPVLVALLLGLFYLHDLVTTKIRAIQAARFVAWESTWYTREDNEPPTVTRKREMTLNTQQKLKERLSKVGLGRGLKNADVFRRKLRDCKSDVSPNGLDPTFFVPAALGDALGDTFGGGDGSTNFINGIADSFSGILNGLSGFAGDVAFVGQDALAQNLNWSTEMNDSVYTARVIYTFGYTSFFKNLGTSTIVQRASVLSHPYTLRRTDDEKEYTELLGSPCSNLFGEDNGHVVQLWLLPSGGFPITIDGFGTSLNSVISTIGDFGKCIASGPGAVLGALDSVLGSSLGFTMPDGTLKEYPELSMPTNSGGTSESGSGSSLGGCENGGGAMGSGTGFDGCS